MCHVKIVIKFAQKFAKRNGAKNKKKARKYRQSDKSPTLMMFFFVLCLRVCGKAAYQNKK